MKTICSALTLASLFITISIPAFSQEESESLLQHTEKCFAALPATKQSQMQFYSVIYRTNAPDCQPKMLVVKATVDLRGGGKKHKIQIFNEDAKGKVQGFYGEVKDHRGSYKLTQKGKAMTYPCVTKNEAFIAENGTGTGEPREVIVGLQRSPPELMDGSQHSENLEVLPGYDERDLRIRIRKEIALRVNASKKPGREVRNQDLLVCLNLLQRSKGEGESSRYGSRIGEAEDLSEAEVSSIEAAESALASWTASGKPGEKEKTRPAKSLK